MSNDGSAALEGQAILGFTGTVTARSKSGLAVHHLFAAQFIGTGVQAGLRSGVDSLM